MGDFSSYYTNNNTHYHHHRHLHARSRHAAGERDTAPMAGTASSGGSRPNTAPATLYKLGDADADLASLGVVPRATLQLFVDSSVEADVQAALDALSQQTSDERHGKPRRAEETAASAHR